MVDLQSPDCSKFGAKNKLKVVHLIFLNNHTLEPKSLTSCIPRLEQQHGFDIGSSYQQNREVILSKSNCSALMLWLFSLLVPQ